MQRFDPLQTLHHIRDGVWPGLDLGGRTLREVREKIRGGDANTPPAKQEHDRPSGHREQP